MKFLVLACIFLNVLLAPWGLAQGREVGAVLESSLSKLRLFRISEFLGAAFVASVSAMIASIFVG